MTQTPTDADLITEALRARADQRRRGAQEAAAVVHAAREAGQRVPGADARITATLAEAARFDQLAAAATAGTLTARGATTAPASAQAVAIVMPDEVAATVAALEALAAQDDDDTHRDDDDLGHDLITLDEDDAAVDDLKAVDAAIADAFRDDA